MTVATSICLHLPSQMPFKAGWLHLNCLLEIVCDLHWLPHYAWKFFESRDRQLWDTRHSAVYLYRYSLTHSVAVGIKAELGWKKTKGVNWDRRRMGRNRKGDWSGAEIESQRVKWKMGSSETAWGMRMERWTRQRDWNKGMGEETDQLMMEKRKWC